MHLTDLTIFVVYLLALSGVVLYFLKKNKGAADDVGGRNALTKANLSAASWVRP